MVMDIRLQIFYSYSHISKWRWFRPFSCKIWRTPTVKSVHLSIHVFSYWFVYSFIYLFVCLFICLFVWVFVCCFMCVFLICLFIDKHKKTSRHTWVFLLLFVCLLFFYAILQSKLFTFLGNSSDHVYKEHHHHHHHYHHPPQNVLCSVEGQLEVMPAVLGVQLRVVEGVREEVVDKGTEGQPVVPARREVGHLDVLGEAPHHTHLAINSSHSSSNNNSNSHNDGDDHDDNNDDDDDDDEE